MYDNSLLCGLARVTLCGIRDLGLTVEDPPVLQHSACGLQAYPKALLAAVAAIYTRGNAGLWWGGGIQPESKLCKWQILCDVQGGDTCFRKQCCGMSINMFMHIPQQ